MKTLAQFKRDPRYQSTILAFVASCLASKAHSETLSRALDVYGNHGSLISGIGRDHFPADVKDVLRSLAGAVTRNSDLGWENRPKRVHNSTMRHLGSLITSEVGHGFYGMRP